MVDEESGRIIPGSPHYMCKVALSHIQSAAVFGIDAHLIDVEVDMYSGGNARYFITVGMPDTSVRESRERIKSALMNSGLGYPNRSVTINLAPANVRKEGAGFDLPMALGAGDERLPGLEAEPPLGHPAHRVGGVGIRVQAVFFPYCRAEKGGAFRVVLDASRGDVLAQPSLQIMAHGNLAVLAAIFLEAQRPLLAEVPVIDEAQLGDCA